MRTRGPVFLVGSPCSSVGAPILGIPVLLAAQDPRAPFFWDPSMSPFPSIRVLEIQSRACSTQGASPAPLLCLPPDPRSPCRGGDPSGGCWTPTCPICGVCAARGGRASPLPPCPPRVPSRAGTWSLPGSSSDSLLPADFVGPAAWQGLGTRGRCTRGQHPRSPPMPCQRARPCLCQAPSGSPTESLEPLAHGSDTVIAARAGIYCQGNWDELPSCDFDIVVN